jgi:hypothetical protein
MSDDRPPGRVGKMLDDLQRQPASGDLMTTIHWGDLTDTELLTMLAEHFELIRRLAVLEGPLRANGVRIPKYRAIALECGLARERILSHLAGET